MTTRSTSRALALACLLLLVAPAAARAAEGAPEEPYKVRVNLAIFYGTQTYAMDDVNGIVADLNDAFGQDPVVAASGLHLEDLTSGAGLGAGIRVWPKRNLLLSFDYQKLKGSTNASVPVSSTPGADSYNTEVKVPASSLGLNVGYMSDWPSRRFRLGAAAGGSYYICRGAAIMSFPDYNQTVELHGEGFGFQGMAVADYAISGAIQLEGALGYRTGSTSDLVNNGVKVLNDDGSDAQADYSGVLLRIGIDIPFGPTK
jgi:hypothetical protein